MIPLMENKSWADQLTVHGEPFVEILAFWELDSKAQVAGALNKCQSILRKQHRSYQCRFGVLPELVLLGTLGYIPAWLEGTCLSSAKDYKCIGRNAKSRSYKPKNVDIVDVSEMAR